MKKLLSVVASAAMIIGLTACSGGSSTGGNAPAASGQQTLTGSGKGIDGDVVVEVVADANQIYSITVTEQNETPGIGSVAVEKIPAAIIDAQSLLVDAVAGATVTTDAIKTGVKAALESGGIDVTVFEKEVASNENVEREDKTIDEYDVVIVGAGGAGLTASVSASQGGAKVLVLEKMPLVGGNSLKATGGMNSAGTKFQEEAIAKEEDPKLKESLEGSTVENFIADTIAGGHDLNDPELVRTMAENSSAAIDWLESIGAPLPEVAATGGTVHMYLHEPEDGSAVGPYLVEKMGAAAEKEGVTVMLNTTATDLIMKDGKVTGVTAYDDKYNYTINSKSVIIATGGFGANFDLMAAYKESLANAVTTNHSGATGDGIYMAMRAGAATVDMEQIQLHPTVYQETGLLVSEVVRSKGGVLVNSSGKRFTNDLATRDAVSNAELAEDGAYSYIIFDQRLVDETKATSKYIESGLTVSADTYEGLAEAMGLTGDAIKNFADTMNKWNDTCKNGTEDEFGRNNGLLDLSVAPYYAIKIAPGIHHTMGGIKINTNAEVLGTDGNAIPGLFACGETTGGVHGGNRIGGNAVCDFVVFGKIAGASAVAYNNK